MKTMTWLMGASIAALGYGAAAQEIGETAVGVGVTTFGGALQAEYQIQPRLGVRGVLMGGVSLDDEFEEEDYTIDGEFDLGGVAVLADYYPMDGAWRVSGGLFLSNTELNGDFTGPENFEGTLAFENEVAPMITTGFRKSFGGGVALSGDIGVVLSSLEASSSSNDPDVQAEIDDLNDDLGDVPVIPFVGFGLSYTF